MSASHITLSLVQFDTLQCAGPLSDLGIEGVLFKSVGADPRSAGTNVRDMSGYKFVIFGLHDSLESAIEFHERRLELAPWTEAAKEIWSAVLIPVRHVGKANYLDQQNPGLLYDCQADAVPEGQLVVLTTAGFDRTDDWLERGKLFGDGVNAVRISMFGVPGLLSTQSFFMGGGISDDGVTVTIWNSFSEMRDAMYGAGVHKDWLLRQKAGGLADRTSFTRCVVERSTGIWHGGDPLQVRV